MVLSRCLPAIERRLSQTRLHARHGQTIVEVLVALAIFVFSISVIYEYLVGTRQQTNKELWRIQAQLLARQQFEELRACPYQSLGPLAQQKTEPVFSPVNSRFLCQTTVAPHGDGVQPALDLMVQVGWNMRTTDAFQPGTSVTIRGIKTP